MVSQGFTRNPVDHCVYSRSSDQPRTLTFNNAEQSVIASSNAEGGIYELALPNDVDGKLRDSTRDGKRGSGSSVILLTIVCKWKPGVTCLLLNRHLLRLHPILLPCTSVY
ncbi:hypothetical protein JB92DRAFT_2910356 [Gautieria morchelliformis]|nr:hypothetical protein JB92DRAFT_2910356 [Gautieria morchelliformis]